MHVLVQDQEQLNFAHLRFQEANVHIVMHCDSLSVHLSNTADMQCWCLNDSVIWFVASAFRVLSMSIADQESPARHISMHRIARQAAQPVVSGS